MVQQQNGKSNLGKAVWGNCPEKLSGETVWEEKILNFMDSLVFALNYNVTRIKCECNRQLEQFLKIARSKVRTYVITQMTTNLYANEMSMLDLKHIYNEYDSLVEDWENQSISHTYPTAKVIRFLRKFIGNGNLNRFHKAK